MPLPTVVTNFSDAVDEAMDRVVAMQELVIDHAQAKKIDWQYDYSSLYWRNTILPFAPQASDNRDFAFRVPISAVLVAGDVQHGYEGTLQSVIMWTWVPRVLAYFTNQRDLKYERQAPPMTLPRFFEDTGLTISFQGLATSADGEGARVYECRFRIELPFRVPLDRSLV